MRHQERTLYYYVPVKRQVGRSIRHFDIRIVVTFLHGRVVSSRFCLPETDTESTYVLANMVLNNPVNRLWDLKYDLKWMKLIEQAIRSGAAKDRGAHLYNGALPFESTLIPEIDLRNATIREAFDQAGITNELASKIAIFNEAIVTNRLTFSARSIAMGEFIEIVRAVNHLEAIRDIESQTLILIPEDMDDGRTARAFLVSPDIYDQIIRPHGSFERLLVEVGVTRRETHVLTDYQRDRSILLIYGSGPRGQSL